MKRMMKVMLAGVLTAVSMQVSADVFRMVGPKGVGSLRCVKSGELMDYTIYFENPTNAVVAVQDVYVTLPKGAGLDWSTFRLGEVVFGENIDTTLSGFYQGESNYVLPGTNWSVKTTVEHTADAVKWHLRIVDPATSDNYPSDPYAGCLPPNDDSGRGEGHLSFSVKVKEDVMLSSIINASASIVFDDNSAIDTDPAWWNMVASEERILAFSGGWNVIPHAGTLSTNETWGTDKAHLVIAEVTVPSGVSLLIEQGAVVKFMPGASLIVENGATCTAMGVVFTHVNDDTIGGDMLYDGNGTVPEHGVYEITGDILDDENTHYRYNDRIALRVMNVSFRQRYPWNGLVDIDFTVKCGEPTNINIFVSAKDEATSKALSMRSVWLENDSTHTNALVMQRGKHRLVWDAGADNPGLVSDAVKVEIQAYVGESPLYMVIDLSGGKDAASYPVSYLADVPQGGWTDDYKTTKLVLRWIPVGTFTMGGRATDYPGASDNGLHQVTLTMPFYVGIFPVTQKQYELVTGNKPSSYKGDARPVEYVSWNTIRGNSSTYNWPSSSDVDASTFMGKVRTKTGMKGFDLPTEAQWEYACRAGTTTALNSGKNLTSTSRDANIDEVGRHYYNQNDGKGGYTSGHTTVGSYLPNAWGIYDMHGSVWEWVLDWHQSNLGTAPMIDPLGPSSGTTRVVRGGSWMGGVRTTVSLPRGGVTIRPAIVMVILASAFAIQECRVWMLAVRHVALPLKSTFEQEYALFLVSRK